MKYKLMAFNKFYCLYGGLSLLILLPLLKLGYVQTMDMSWGPRVPLPATSDNSYLFVGLLHILSIVISSMVVQKILLLAIFWLAGAGAYRLCRLAPRLKSSEAAVVGGLFYMFNPFIYSRLMEGQYLVLCGYALLPWAIASFWQLIQKPSWRQAISFGAWSIGIGLTSIHAVGFLLLACVVIYCAQSERQIKRDAKYILGVIFAWLIADGLWLVPIINGTSHTSSAIGSFGASQLQAFKTVGTIHGSVPLSSLLLEGFWADTQGRYYLPSHLGFYWWVVVMLLAGLVIFGIYNVIKKRDKLGICLLILAVVAWWLGMGVGWSASAGTSNWLVAHIPFYRGYREPQKWLMLLALAYSYFIAVGSTQVLELIKRVEWRQATLGFMALLPILFTPMLLWGAGGQLVSAQYPSDWALAERTLNADKSNYKVLVLPWHEYLPISFVKRDVANPANHYFKQNLIISDNPEISGVPPTESTPLYKLLDSQIIPERGLNTDDASRLAPYSVKYVLLLKETDWQSYGWVDQQTGWQLVQNTAHLQLYELR